MENPPPEKRSRGGTQAPRDVPPRNVENELLVLAEYQKVVGCKQDVGQFIRPYIEECLRRCHNNENFITLKLFFAQSGICDICWHSDVPHHRAQCATVCCQERRCGKCLHQHYSGRCLCSHTNAYVDDLRARISRLISIDGYRYPR